MTKPSTADVAAQAELVAAYEAFLGRFLPRWKQDLGLRTALEVGVVPGCFSEFLRAQGFEADAVDARAPQPWGSGVYDVVLAFGLAPEVHDPFGDMPRLHAATGKLLIVESYCLPEETPLTLLCDERGGEHGAGRGGEHEAGGRPPLACCLSEGALIKMAFHAGYTNVYRFRELPDHEQFQRVVRFDRVHTMLVAANCEVRSPLLERAAEPVISLTEGLWGTSMRGVSELLGRLGRGVRHRKR